MFDEAFDAEFKKLNEMQRKAVLSIEDNALILAPAGTGKTKVIAMRSAYMLRNNIPPSQILCLTFTNKAAKEMEARISTYAKEALKELTIRTFHSFCYFIISNEKKYAHFAFPCTILDEADTVAILERITASLKETYTIQSYTLTHFIENIKKYSLTFEEVKRYDYAFIVKDYLKNHKVKEKLLIKYGLKIFTTYQNYLKSSHCIDFTDLILEATYLLEQPEISSRWQHRYTYIQVDEMQDTSQREYALIKCLAKGNHIALFGDFNQTIYEWRGSAPYEMIVDFKAMFSPLEFTLTINYRSTQVLLQAANDYIDNSKLYPLECTSKSSTYGELIKVIIAPTKPREFTAIAQSILENSKEDFSKAAVLTRTNGYSKELYGILTSYGIPCIKIDDVKLFRKKEVKDCLAFLGLLSNPRNAHALETILIHPFIAMEPWLIKQLRQTKSSYMYLHDWFAAESDDPYTPLFKGFRENKIVVLDVESTGLDTTQDEIIQIAAIVYGKDGVKSTLDLLVKPTRKVRDSFYIHGFSDALLSKEGLDPVEALSQLLQFAKEKIVVGHNVKYDLEIIKSMLHRYKLPSLDLVGVYDTLDLAYKIYPTLANHRLDTLSKLVMTKTAPTHNALQDILATSEVLKHFIEKLQTQHLSRLNHLEQFYPYVLPYKERLRALLKVLQVKPTYTAIEYLMNTCHFKAYYTNEQVISLRDFYKMTKELYDETLSLQDNIIKLLTFSSLHYSELEQTAFFKNRIPIMTIHQAKGLEFEDVYLAGCNDRIFPSSKSIKEGYLEEEKRLFYVGMTRAKKQLYLTYNTTAPRSLFIDEIGETYKQYKPFS